MAAYSVAADEVAANAKTLVAATADTVTFTGRDLDKVEVVSDGTAAVYFSVDGSTPTVAGAKCFSLPAASVPVSRIVSVATAGATVVKVISAGTPTYWVTEVK